MFSLTVIVVQHLRGRFPLDDDDEEDDEEDDDDDEDDDAEDEDEDDNDAALANVDVESDYGSRASGKTTVRTATPASSDKLSDAIAVESDNDDGNSTADDIEVQIAPGNLSDNYRGASEGLVPPEMTAESASPTRSGTGQEVEDQVRMEMAGMSKDAANAFNKRKPCDDFLATVEAKKTKLNDADTEELRAAARPAGGV